MQMSEEKLKIRPPLSAQNNKEVAALKAELEIELKSKKQCAYQPYECTQLTVDCYKYCPKHILQDKNAPFKQCSFIYTNNGKRCPLPAPKNDKKDIAYCTEHSVMTTLARNRQSSRFPPPQTAEVILCSLSQYVKKPRNKAITSGIDDVNDRCLTDDLTDQRIPKNIDPFRDIDANKLYNTVCKDLLDVCSESDSDIDASTFASVWHDSQADSSDNESIDSEEEDPLKHANVYTAEEITQITRDKLIKLQSLYIEQYRHLQHILREKKRKYFQSLRREKETYCNIYNQIRENPKEQRLYQKLKAYNKYHKTHGVEAVLNKRLHDLRAKITDGIPTKTYNYMKCLFTEGGVKCGERALPLAKHCRKHILEDPNQVLFKACGKLKGDTECNTPIEMIFEDATCRLHMDMPPIRSYNQMRKNSESDFDDSLEAPDGNALLAELDSNSTKPEYMDFKAELSRMDTVPNELFEDDIVLQKESLNDCKSDEEIKTEEKDSSDTSMRTESCEGDNKLDKDIDFSDDQKMKPEPKSD